MRWWVLLLILGIALQAGPANGWMYPLVLSALFCFYCLWRTARAAEDIARSLRGDAGERRASDDEVARRRRHQSGRTR